MEKILLDQVVESLISCQNDSNDLNIDVLKRLYDSICRIVTEYETYENKGLE